MAKCTVTNGTYSCQYEHLKAGEQHTGVHYAYYTNADGLARIAYWTDQYGPMRVIKAPAPAISKPVGAS